jgi:diguanylate cyclase (GGDEF)-like protein
MTGNRFLVSDHGLTTEALPAERLPSGSQAAGALLPDENARGPLWRGIWRGSQSDEGWTRQLVLRLAGVFVVLTVCSWLGIVLSHQSEGVATIWLTNGLLFGLVITQPRRLWLGYFAAGLAADTLADVVYGDPFRLAIGVSCANSVEVIASCLLLTLFFGTPLNLAKRRPLVGFLLISVVGAAAVTSALGATWTMLFTEVDSWWQMFRTWYLGDMLGMALLAPVVFMLQRPGFFSMLQPGQRRRDLLVLLAPIVATALVFTHERDPLIFFIFPGFLLVVILLGFSGTVFSLFAVALLSIALTVKGHGPLMLITGPHAPLERIVVAQVFLAVAIFTMFPIAALLEERAALQLSLAASEARYRALANFDELTGLYNRRAFNERLNFDWRRAAAAESSLALLLIDADLFKSYNDAHGHLRGDQCLRSIAGIISVTVSDGDATVARFGGEEFAVVLPGKGEKHARLLAERIRLAVLEMCLPHPSSPSGMQTVSLGVAAAVPDGVRDAAELIGIADVALYRAKGLGRNQVVVA